MATASLDKIYEGLKHIEANMATKHDVEGLVETIRILSNPDTMMQISRSERDISNGRVAEVLSDDDLLR